MRHEGIARAASRDDVYADLRRQGIRPFNVVPMPGILNRILGFGKRGVAIVILALTVIVLVLVNVSRNDGAAQELFESRAQIYGDPAVLHECEQAGWTNVFPRLFDAYLAKYAIPGKVVVRTPLEEGCRPNCEYVVPAESDYAEVAMMKRIVNGMKREFRQYIEDGGTLSGYLDRLAIRQNAELSIYQKVRVELLKSDDLEEWKTRNAMLRAMGLQMVSEEEKLGGKKK